MTQDDGGQAARLCALLQAPDPSVRLHAALAAGTHPAGDRAEVLVQRCAVEPDPAVRDMLTWAIVRHPAAVVLDLLRVELTSAQAQARSQALHTLSKLRDPRTWPWITEAHLADPDDEVARTAWRTAVALVPDDRAAGLAAALAAQLGRGGRDVRRSLSRALVDLGPAAAAAVEAAASSPEDAVRAHALATQRLALDPWATDDVALAEAARVVALLGAPVAPG